MDKYLITAFRSEIATAILNSQKRLNPDGDAYISKDELPAVLDFFGETDVTKLLKDPNADTKGSIFTGNGATESAAASESAEENVDYSKYSELMDSNNAVLRDDGTAAYELLSSNASDILISSVGTPYAAQMKSLYETRKALTKKSQDTEVIDNKIDALNKAVQEYIKLHQAEITKRLADNEVVKTFKYGHNGEKTGYYVQTFSVKANNTISKDNDGESTETGENSGDNNNHAVGGVIYNIEVVTDKLHAIGHIDADSENSDISLVAAYKERFKNGGNLNFSGNFRQTIEKDNNQTNAGLSLDYSKNKFSTGAFASYENNDTEGLNSKNIFAEGYARYGRTFRGGVGIIHESAENSSSSEKYVKAKISGKRTLNNSNITLTGSLEAKYGITSMDVNEGETKGAYNLPNQDICANGGISFQSGHSDFATNILASVNYCREKSIVVDNTYDAAVTATLLGNVSTKKIDVTATLTASNFPHYEMNEEQHVIPCGRKTNWSSSITFGLKKLFGKNITPSFTYNLNSNFDGEIEHNMAVNMGIDF